jgi:hypothetical protein
MLHCCLLRTGIPSPVKDGDLWGLRSWSVAIDSTDARGVMSCQKLERLLPNVPGKLSQYFCQASPTNTSRGSELGGFRTHPSRHPAQCLWSKHLGSLESTINHSLELQPHKDTHRHRHRRRGAFSPRLSAFPTDIRYSVAPASRHLPAHPSPSPNARSSPQVDDALRFHVISNSGASYSRRNGPATCTTPHHRISDASRIEGPVGA